MLLAYISPDTMMPVTSVVAATVGVALMFGRRASLVVRSLWRRVWHQTK